MFDSEHTGTSTELDQLVVYQIGPWTRTKRESRMDPKAAAEAELSPNSIVPPTAFNDVTNLKGDMSEHSPGMLTRSAAKKRSSQLLVQ